MKRRNIVCGRKEELSSKMRKIFGERKYFGGEKKSGEGKAEKHLLWRTREREKENEEIFGEGKCLVSGGEEKEGNVRSGEEEKSGDGKGGQYFGVLE